MSEKINLKIGGGSSLNLGISKASGTNNYNALTNKPSINGVELVGDKTSDEIHVQGKMHALTTQEIERILYVD